jgi:hypothetical protein
MTFLRTGKTGRVLLGFGSIALVTAPSPAIAEASGAGADPSAASLAPLSVRGQTRRRWAMSISLVMEHMLTKTRPVLPAGQVPAGSKKANERPSH